MNQPALSVALRQVARAFVRDEWSLTGMSHRAFSDLLQAGGYDVSIDQLKNASRPAAKLMAHAVRPTDEVRRLCDYLKSQFPQFREDLLLSS